MIDLPALDAGFFMRTRGADMATLEEVLASVTTLLARYSAALSVDGGSKILTLGRTGTGDTAAVVIQQGGAERFRMGQIGADTFALQRSPTGAAVDYTDVLSVNRSTGAVTLAGALTAPLAPGSAASPSLYFNGSPSTGFFSPGGNNIAASVGGTRVLTLDSNGNVAIGVAGPSIGARLQVGNSANAQEGTAANVLIGLADNDTGFFKPTFNTIGVAVGGIEAMRIDSAGRVGIGTSAPGALLEVSTGAFHTRFAGNSVTFSRDGPSYIDALAGSASILYRAAASHQVHVGGVEIARFGPAGLGIGKNATLPLDVAGAGRFVQAVSGAVAHSNYDNLIVENNSNAGITVLTPNNSIGGLVFKDPENATIGDGGMYYEHSLDRLSVGTFSVGHVRLVAGGVEGMRLLGTGQLLIGTTAPGGSKLRVSGLPTSSAGLSAGDIWNDGGNLKIA